MSELISRTEAQNSRAETQDSGPAVRPDAHELLLELAGRLDDDLLAWARELVAVGEEGRPSSSCPLPSPRSASRCRRRFGRRS